MKLGWKQLENDITNWLQSFATDKIAYAGPYQAIVGFPTSSFRSDGMLTDGHVLLAIEIEAGQMHPDTNVGKYWLLGEKYRSYKQIVLYHIYTPDYNSYGWRKELAEFYAVKMKDDIAIEYILLDFRDKDNYDEVVRDIKSIIQPRIAQQFGVWRSEEAT